MHPMQAKPNKIRMLSVKKEHPLAGNCGSRRKTQRTGMYEPATTECGSFRPPHRATAPSPVPGHDFSRAIEAQQRWTKERVWNRIANLVPQGRLNLAQDASPGLVQPSLRD